LQECLEKEADFRDNTGCMTQREPTLTGTYNICMKFFLRFSIGRICVDEEIVKLEMCSQLIGHAKRSQGHAKKCF
jgi:hypothetical protein